MKIGDLQFDTNLPYRTLPEMVTHALREAILGGELKGGVQLKQEGLAAKFNVSMSALREALKNLEAEGLVTFFPNRGAVVTELSADEAREIFDIRLFLELGMLELAIPNLSDSDLAKAERILAEADNKAGQGERGELNRLFHETLYRPANRPRLFAMIQNTHNNVERYMRIYLSTQDHLKKSQLEHRTLLDACAKKDVKKAQKLLRKHLSDASNDLAEYLSR